MARRSAPSTGKPSRLTIDDLRRKYGADNRLSLADFNAPRAVEALLKVFASCEIVFDVDVPSDQHLRSLVADAAGFSYQIPDHLTFQDKHSRELLSKLWEAAATLDSALNDVWDYGDTEDATSPTEKINLCEGFFPGEEEFEGLRGMLMALALTVETNLSRGAKSPGRGRQPLLLFYEFVRRLHFVFEAKTSTKGFYEKDGTAKGPFVALIFEAQRILPKGFQHADARTIGNRIIEAFTEKNSREKH